MTDILHNLFVAAAYGSVADIEIVWVVLASIGLCFSIYNWKEARADMAAVVGTFDNEIELKSDRRYILAFSSIRAEIARAIIQTIFLAIGLSAFTIPGTPTSSLPLKYQIFSILFTWGLIVSSSLLTLKSYWIYRLRVSLLDSITRDELAQKNKADYDAKPDSP